MTGRVGVGLETVRDSTTDLHTQSKDLLIFPNVSCFDECRGTDVSQACDCDRVYY